MGLIQQPRFDNRFVNELPGDPELANFTRQVEHALWSSVLPTPVSSPKLIAYSAEVAAMLDLTQDEIRSATFTELFSGNKILAGMQPYSTNYGGHQFGHWAGQLGDGRAINLCEIVNRVGNRLEIQLKGAGPTPYSRRADGRAVLRSSIREFLCSEAMYHLGIATTRALCLMTTGDSVMRDMFYNGNNRPEPGAVVCRVAPSFIRFGHFELLAMNNEQVLLAKLVDFTISRDFRELMGDEKTKYRNWFKTICHRTAHLIVDWLRVGFVHGVMNTDNMSILGLTIDYGPYGWLDNYDQNWTPNTTDAEHRRYAYGNQATIAYWNLQCLAKALKPIFPSIEPIEEGLDHFVAEFNASYQQMINEKFGFRDPANKVSMELAEQAFALMQQSEVDMTCFFRQLAEIDLNAPDLHLLDNVFYQDELRNKFSLDWHAWLQNYANHCHNSQSQLERRTAMNKVNPRYILRNYLVQEAIDLAEVGDYSRIHQLMKIMQEPYDEKNDQQKFAEKRPDWARNRAGCSMLSCSS